ncbi:MAG: hypothetical protein WC269_01995 [Candidatus Gracilibacteria bacterium]|jgi:hypothetical protein
MGENDIEQPVLLEGERIGIQTAEGPCSAGCKECYERPAMTDVLARLLANGLSMDYLWDYINWDPKIPGVLCDFALKDPLLAALLKTGPQDFLQYFRLCTQIGIKNLFLIGSEPTAHENFDEVLDLAESSGVKLMVYTGGGNLDKLQHTAVDHVVLHVNYGEGVKDGVCTPEFLKKVNDLLARGVKIDCRVNFSSAKMREKSLIHSFYEGIRPEFRQNVLLKYSFNAKALSSVNHITPDGMRAVASDLISFIDDFLIHFPEVSLFAERPIFPCAFPDDVWEQYAQIGGFRAKCDMEYTFYQDGLGLCPPARRVVPRIPVATPDELRAAIATLRGQVREVKFETSSFPECEECRQRVLEVCQGGCSCYKEEPRGCSQIMQNANQVV